MKANPLLKIIPLACALFLDAPCTHAAMITPPSWAGGAGYGWACYPIGGLLANTGELQETQDSLVSAIKSFGQTINKGQYQQMQTTLNTLNQTLQEWALSQKEMRAKQAAVKVILAGQPASLPQNPCASAASASDINTGLVQSAANAVAMSQAVRNFNDVSIPANASITRLATAPAQTLQAHTLFASSGSTPDTASTINDQVKYIANLTNPMPSRKLTTMQGLTPAGVAWKAYDHASTAPISLAQNALSYIASQQQATIPAAFFTSQWQSMGNTAPPPGVNANNLISPDGALSMEVAARFANGGWYTHLAAESKIGVLREINLMAAVQTRIEMNELKTASYLAAITAAQYAQQYVAPMVDQSNVYTAQAAAQSSR